MSDKTEFAYTLTDAEDDALMDALHRHAADFDDEDFRAVVARLIAPHAERAQRHYAAFVGAEAFGQRVVVDAQRRIEELCPHEPDQHAEGTCEVCDYAFALAAAFENEADDGGWHCAHEWLYRPESDTRECLICGTEVAG